MNDWEWRQMTYDEWRESTFPPQPLYPEGTIPEDMSLREYSEIQADYIKATEGKASLDPVIVMQWWAENNLDTRPLSYEIDPHEQHEVYLEHRWNNPEDESELY